MRNLTIFRILLLFVSNCIYAQYDPQQFCQFNDYNTDFFINDPWYNQISSNAISLTIPINCNEDPYVLVFEDNFKGNQLDRGKWKPEVGPRGESNAIPFLIYEDVFYDDSPETIEVNGKLNIHANYHQNHVTRSWDWNGSSYNHTYDFDYTSGCVNSTVLIPQGMIEINCKLPAGCRMFPAFWLFGAPYGTSNEIDIFEFPEQNSPFTDILTHIGMNVHYKFNQNAPAGGDCPYSSTCPIDNAATSFHKYTLKWDDFTIEWFCDNRLERTYYRYLISGSNLIGPIWPGRNCPDINFQYQQHNLSVGYYENLNYSRDPMQIKINTSVLASNVVNCTDNPNTNFEIQYVKYYKQMPSSIASSDISITDEENNLSSSSSLIHYLHPVQPWLWPTNSGEYSSIVGHTITFGSINNQPSTVYLPYLDLINPSFNTIGGEPDQDPAIQLTAIAQTSIDLLPGFEVDANSAYNYYTTQSQFSGWGQISYDVFKTSYFDASVNTELYNSYNPNNGNPCPDGLRKQIKKLKNEKQNTLNNFPNPFSNQTSINFTIMDSSSLSIIVYDAYGAIIDIPIKNIHFSKGTHSINFNSVNLNPGVYYYSLISSTFNETKKMILIK